MFISLLIFSIQNKQVAPLDFNCNMPETLTQSLARLANVSTCHMLHWLVGAVAPLLSAPFAAATEDLCQMAEDQISCG